MNSFSDKNTTLYSILWEFYSKNQSNQDYDNNLYQTLRNMNPERNPFPICVEATLSFETFINGLTSLFESLKYPNLSSVLKMHTLMHLNGIVYIVNKSALNLVSEDLENQEGSLPVYAYYSKELVSSLPPLKVYTDTKPELYLKSLAPHLHNISFVKKMDITSSKNYGDLDRRTVLSSFMCDATFSSSGKVIPLKSLSTGTKFDYDITTYTEARFKREKCLAPVLTPIDIYDFETKTYIKANFYTFVFNSKPARLKKYVKARKYFHKVLNSLLLWDSVYFRDKKKYNRLYYSSNLKRFIPTDQEENYEQIKDFPIKSILDQSFELNNDNFLKIAKKYKYPQEFDQKKASLSNKQQTVKLEAGSMVETLCAQRGLFVCFKNENTNIRIHEARLKEAQKKYLQTQAKIRSSFEEVPKIIAAIKTNIRKSKALFTANKQLDKDVKRYRSQNAPSENESLRNILQNIDIINISLRNIATREVIDLDLSQKALVSSGLFLNTPIAEGDFELINLHYCTKAPHPINVIGSKQQKVGGPYEVSLNRNHNDPQMRIRPKSLNTYYAITATMRSGSKRILTHPHSAGSVVGSQSISEFKWERCCLGEVSSILYKAWSDLDFTQIFIATDLWLNSANAIDQWGRRYKLFEDWSDHLYYKQHNEITETFVSNQNDTLTPKIDLPFNILPKVLQETTSPPCDIQEHQVVTDRSVVLLEDETVTRTDPVTVTDSVYTPYIRLAPQNF